ncbi:MAG: hypothetical protein WAX80_00125 [Minisyncoccia bacterium]
MQYLQQKIYDLLRRSEGFLKADMVYLAKGGFWLSINHVVAMLAGFGLSLAFANLFPKESFGTYKFILSIAAILGTFSLTEMGTAVTQAVARGFNGSLRQGFRLSLKWSFGILLGGLGLGLYYYLNGNLVLSISFISVGLLLPISQSASLYNAYLLGKKDFKRISFYGMVHNILPAIVLTSTLILFPQLSAIIIVYFGIAVLVTLFLYRKTLLAYQADNSEQDPELPSYSGHLSAMEIIGKSSGYLDKILIFHYLGAIPLAIYAFAIAPVEQLQGGKKILTSLILPKSSEQSFEELQRSAPRKTILLTLYALCLAGIWILLAPYFYKLFYPQYLDSVFFSQVYSLTLLAISGSVLEQTLVAHKKKRELYLYKTIVPVVRIALFFILLPLFGLMGLIVTHVIIRSFSGVMAYYFVRHPISN